MHMVLREMKEDRNNPTAWTPYNPTWAGGSTRAAATGDLYAAGAESYD